MRNWLEKISNLQIGIIFFIVGFLIYFLSIFNGFVADDNVYIVGNPHIQNFNLLSFFKGSSYYSGNILELSGIYYKPIFTLITSLIYNLSNGQPYLFHIIQIFIHCINSFLIFILFRRFFSKNISLFLSLIFLIHPGNSEAVVYAANLQDVLFFMFGISALNLIFVKELNIKHYLLIFSFLLIALLSKESGILFLPSIIVLTLIFKKNSFQVILINTITVFLLYIYLRFEIAKVFINSHAIAPIMEADFMTKFITMPKIIFTNIGLFLFPLNLSWGQHWVVEKIDFSDFYFPVLIILLFVLLSCFMFLKLTKESKKIHLFFIAVVIFGLGLHMQIIPLDFTFAERWLYFPFFGFLGITGVVLSNIKFKKINRKYIYVLIIFILMLLSFRTFLRTLDWKNDFTLASRDTIVNRNSFALENNLGYELIKRKNYKEAIVHLEKSISLYPIHSSLNNIAFAYSKIGRSEDSLRYYKQAVKLGDFYLSYQNYIAELIRQNKIAEASNLLKDALGKFPNNPNLWLLNAIREYNSNQFEKAIYSLQKANNLSPGIANYLYNKMKNKEKIIF